MLADNQQQTAYDLKEQKLHYLLERNGKCYLDSATSWIEPTEQALMDAMDLLENNKIYISEREFLEVFHAWMIFACDTATALGHTISDMVREEVRVNYGGYGLKKDWNFPEILREIMGWKEKSQEANIWRRVLNETFLDTMKPDNGRLYEIGRAHV